MLRFDALDLACLQVVVLHAVIGPLLAVALASFCAGLAWGWARR